MPKDIMLIILVCLSLGSSPVGVFPKPENCVFVPVPCELRFHQAERSGIDLLASTASVSLAPSPSSPAPSAQPITDLEILERSIESVSIMLDRLLVYVRSVLSGEKKGDPAVGRYLMDTLGAGIGTGELEKGGFNASLQVGK
jgi:translation initiation factor 3 subunit F